MRFLLLLLFPIYAHGAIFIGDSITAHPEAWPSYLDGHHQVMAQYGRTIRDFDPPRDLQAGLPFDTVVYSLGTNDIISGHEVKFWRPQFISHIEFLQSRGFRVVVLIPPEYPTYKTNFQHVMALTCIYYDFECYSAPYDPNLTSDTIHPLPALQRDIAYFVENLI